MNRSVELRKGTIFHPYVDRNVCNSIHDAIRFRYLVLQKIRYYIMYDNGKMIGYCAVFRGGGIRYPFTTKADILIGPLFVSEHFRRKHIGETLLKIVLHQEKYEIAYAFIQKTNTPSIKAFKKLGFLIRNEATYSKKFHILQKVSNGDFVIMERNKYVDQL